MNGVSERLRASVLLSAGVGMAPGGQVNTLQGERGRKGACNNGRKPLQGSLLKAKKVDIKNQCPPELCGRHTHIHGCKRQQQNQDRERERGEREEKEKDKGNGKVRHSQKRKAKRERETERKKRKRKNKNISSPPPSCASSGFCHNVSVEDGGDGFPLSPSCRVTRNEACARDQERSRCDLDAPARLQDGVPYPQKLSPQKRLGCILTPYTGAICLLHMPAGSKIGTPNGTLVYTWTKTCGPIPGGFNLTHAHMLAAYPIARLGLAVSRQERPTSAPAEGRKHREETGFPIWVWVKIKPPGIGPQGLVLSSICQGSILVPIFDPRPNVHIGCGSKNR